MEYVYGASEYFGANRKEGIAGMSFSINGIQGVFSRDDKGNYFVIGLNVKAKYKNDNNEVIVHVYNNVYDTFYVDDKGEFHMEASIPANYMEGRFVDNR